MDEGYTYSPQDAQKRGMPLRVIAVAVLGAFLLGILVTFLLTRDQAPQLADLFRVRSDEAPAALASTPSETEPTPEATASQPAEVVAQEARQTAQRVEQVVEQTGGIDQRVAAMEQRLTRLDLQSQAAAGNAARAEGLLIAFASRRAIERGQPLGYLEDQLWLRFGDARPNAVQTVVDASADLVTLDQLLVRLDGLAPELVGDPSGENVLTWIGRELSQLFVVRTEDTPSPVAQRRMERARIYLETGRIEYAVNEIRNMPNSAIADEWLAQAERYGAAQRALETLELAAILEPRELRNAQGERVAQPSPLQPRSGSGVD